MNRYLVAVMVAAAPAAAWAGCGDALVFRVDWTEKLSFDEAKLHGAYAWEASPDGWATHPIGGKELGFVHLRCGTGDDACTGQLAAFTAGTSLHFTGQFTTARPEWTHPEGDPSTPVLSPWPGSPQIVVGAATPVWTEAQALPKNVAPGTTQEHRGCDASGGGLVLLAALGLARRSRRRGTAIG